eukprot:CAMPEP_0181332354 /NCGR_PEP_ID=MMETSP1101-20121128/25049_1 /TAXON_ID=46948 /ORGANISM="Rhodomonas abbreviata, Strain Caron Lab Isolate" /LENGTH=282 /DNA_ID=CAMNT_0023441993 /DNA_START=241 /DNA_END=1089 /DNA_ORIENTATION=+
MKLEGIQNVTSLGSASSPGDNSTLSPSTAPKTDVQSGEDAPPGKGHCAIPELPVSIQLKEDFWAFLHTIRVRSGDRNHDDLGYVQSHPFSMTSSQTWYDASGKQIAASWRDFISFEANVYVGDCEGQRLAVVQEELAASATSTVTFLTVKDDSGLEFAKSEASQQFENQIDVIDMHTGKQSATIRSRPGGDFWDINLPTGGGGSLGSDPRVFVMAVAAESAPLAFGLGPPLFVALLTLFALCVCGACLHMARASDPDDPRFGLFAAFDSRGTSYSEINDVRV